MEASYSSTELGQFLDLVASREAAPGGGAVAAVTVSLAAGLVAMAARLSPDQIPDSAALTAEADRIRLSAARLADDDAHAYRRVLAAYSAARRTGSTTPGDPAVRSALEQAARVPLEVSALGARAAALAARLAVEGNPPLRGDAATAVAIAQAAVGAAARLVSINVEEGGGDQSLVEEARRNVELATEAQASLEGAL
jgi:formiminotetrahydrofolate cyclodeaminase